MTTIADALPAGLTMDAVYAEVAAFLGAAVVLGILLIKIGLRLAPQFVKAVFRSTIRA